MYSYSTTFSLLSGLRMRVVVDISNIDVDTSLANFTRAFSVVKGEVKGGSFSALSQAPNWSKRNVPLNPLETSEAHQRA